MTILVYGAGAIGSVLGGFLAKSGHQVTLFGRSWHLDSVRRDGLVIRGIWGEHQVQHLTCATTLEQLTPGAYEWILLCVKAYDTEAAVAPLARLMGERTLLCASQNGLGNYETLTAQIDPSRVALSRVIFGVELEPGIATVTVNADDVRLGAPDARFPQARLDELAAALRAGGVPCQVSDRIVTVLWGKVLYNCALNALSTVLEVPYGALLERESTRELMRRVIHEAYQVAAAHQVALEPATAESYVERLFTRLIPDTAAHYPSMLQDLRRGRRTEIEAMNGALARLGAARGLTTPANALLTRLVHAKARL